eukprot:jgi/Bigna1/80313/fgenesh1_pg.70_\
MAFTIGRGRPHRCIASLGAMVLLSKPKTGGTTMDNDGDDANNKEGLDNIDKKNGGKKKLNTGVVVLAGNPMLDVSLSISSKTLQELGLSEGQETRSLPRDATLNILQNVKQNPASASSAGGSAVNTAMALQWALGNLARNDESSGTSAGDDAEGFLDGAAGSSDIQACVCIGAVGDDEPGHRLETALRKANVRPLFQKIQGVPTGQCAILVPEESGDRSIVAVRGAYRHLDSKFITCPSSPAHKAIEEAEILYCTSFLTSTEDRFKAVDYMASYAQKAGKLFALNLSSASMLGDVKRKLDDNLSGAMINVVMEVDIIAISQLALSSANKASVEIRKRVISLLPRTSLLFSNESEAKTLALALQKNKSFPHKNKSFLHKKNMGKKKMLLQDQKQVVLMLFVGIMAVTRGANTTLIATRSPISTRRFNNSRDCLEEEEEEEKEEEGNDATAITIKEYPIYVGDHEQQGNNGQKIAIKTGNDGCIVDNDDLDYKLGPVVDTNGAGDAFVGGYLAAIAAGHSLDSNQAVESGHFAAGIAVRCRGAVWEGSRLLPSPKPL